MQEVEEEIEDEEADNQEEAEYRRYVEFSVICTYYPNGYLPEQEPTAPAGTNEQATAESQQAEGQVE